jgi:NADH:ubiquinone oxidoreductase subunit 5 (subunit L)/multisubunit Na+/H+ antiporter MnhA subunit
VSFNLIIDALKNPNGYFVSTPLSLLCAAFAAMFFVFAVLYSIKHMKGHKGLWRYYIYLVATFIATLGILFSTTFILLLILWGFLGLMLYLLIGFGRREGTPESARKSLVIIGGTDVLLLFGIVLIWRMVGGDSGFLGFLHLPFGQLSIPLAGSNISVIAYLCLASAAFAKAGAMPFHTWLPDTARDAPVPVTAYLPASLDKLLGIYFLARVTLDVFQMTPAMNTILMALGSLTIMAAVMMALVQHDLKRLLGYHAVSQVGYMVLGIGTGNPVGIAGALFHMFNNTIYKSSLFLAGGEVERRAGTSDLSKLGGLVKAMPLVFVAFLIASLSISGVPPFNGFASKWMLYQGIIMSGGSGLWVLWLVAAMLGSALTLASFMKLIHTVFLGQPSEISQKVIDKKEKTGILTMLPLTVLSLLCIGLGIFAWKIPFGEYFNPEVTGQLDLPGIWQSGLATIMLIVSLLIGYLIYLAGTLKKARIVEPFVGGETLVDNPDMRVSGVDFYKTIQELGVLKGIYRWAEKKLFDLYVVAGKFVAGFGIIFSFMHNGILSRYFLWFIVGLVVICIVLI